MRLIEHLPPRLRMVAEYRALCAAVEEELSTLRTGIEAVRRNLVISTAEDEGLSRFESAFGMVGDGSFADRRAAILARSVSLPYSLGKVEERLRTMVGENGYQITLRGAHLDVLISLEAKNAYRAVCATLREVVPANVALTVRVKLTENRELVELTHAELARYTQEEIRNEVATVGRNN